MVDFWYIKGDFLKERSKRIGASDVPALIPDPENPTQSLAGYDRTPISVVLEKQGKIDREPPGLPAEKGHHDENKSLEWFIRDVFSYEEGLLFRLSKDKYDTDLDLARFKKINYPNAIDYQASKILKHSTQWYDYKSIVHPDCVYMGGIDKKIRAFGINIDLSKPFLIEGKSATYWSAKRPEDSIIKGYDFDLQTWQGIPLKHYMQIQQQLNKFEIETCYLALIYNTSEFHVWEIKDNKKHQKEIDNIVDEIHECIVNDTIPVGFALNQKDIKSIYPNLKDDFHLISGKEKEKALEIVKIYNQAKSQKNKWEEKEKEALDSMSILLKDFPEIRDDEGSIAKWLTKKGYEKVISLKELKEKNDKAYKYLKRKKLIINIEGSKSVLIKRKDV